MYKLKIHPRQLLKLKDFHIVDFIFRGGTIITLLTVYRMLLTESEFKTLINKMTLILYCDKNSRDSPDKWLINAICQQITGTDRQFLILIPYNDYCETELMELTFFSEVKAGFRCVQQYPPHRWSCDEDIFTTEYEGYEKMITRMIGSDT
jgi:hypothetical protein